MFEKVTRFMGNSKLYIKEVNIGNSSPTYRGGGILA